MEWISVEDRLPEDDSLVVAAHFYEFDISPDAAVCWFINGEFYFHDEGVKAENYDGGAVIQLDLEITHWCSLPPQD